MRTSRIITTILIAAATTVAAFSQSKTSRQRERLLFTTNFSDFPNLSANNNCPININKTTLYTKEKVTVKVVDTQITPLKKRTADGGGMMKTVAAPDAYILISPLKNISRLTFQQSDGGFKLEAKGDGDAGWVTLGTYPSGRRAQAREVRVNVNRKNCQLRFTNASAYRACLRQLTIYGAVSPSEAVHDSATVVYHNMDGDRISIQKIKLGSTIGSMLNGRKVTVPQGMLFKGWCMNISGIGHVTPTTRVKANMDLYPLYQFKSQNRVGYTIKGGYYLAKAGSAESVLAIFKAIAADSRKGIRKRYLVYLPNGKYDFGNRTEITPPCDNVSIIGQSMDSTLLVTRPEAYKEGLGTADFFYNTHKNIYFRDLTLKNALDHYGHGGRAAVMHDCGTRTIYKNVRMLSYQDTYFSENNNMQSYFEGCDIHGKTDFICGGGDVMFYNTTISLEPRELTTNKGGRIITAPSSTTAYGYVFDHCRIVDLAHGEGSWVYGRMWRNTPICVWLNTTLDDNSAKTLSKSRWVEKGMNNTDPKLIGEYATLDESGRNITPASNIIHSYDGDHETVLTTSQASGFTYEKMFGKWDPREVIKRSAFHIGCENVINE
jgi:hypothetical protein